MVNWKLVGILLLAAGLFQAGAARAGHEGDPHYTAAGFFDVHVCNWPDNPRFLMALFSTARFNEVEQVSVFAPDGRHVGDLDLTRFRAFKTKAGIEKRAFISNFDLPEKAPDGWYRAEITLKDGSHFEGRDFVIHYFMAQPAGMEPAPGAKDVPASVELKWNPVPGAKYYKIYLQDVWASTETESPLLTEAHWQPPAGLLKAGNDYTWRINARDSDETILLGDFNHGSLSPEFTFTIK